LRSCFPLHLIQAPCLPITRGRNPPWGVAWDALLIAAPHAATHCGVLAPKDAKKSQSTPAALNYCIAALKSTKPL